MKHLLGEKEEKLLVTISRLGGAKKAHMRSRLVLQLVHWCLIFTVLVLKKRGKLDLSGAAGA